METNVLTVEDLKRRLDRAMLLVAMLIVVVGLLVFAWMFDGGLARLQGKVITREVQAEKIVVQRKDDFGSVTIVYPSVNIFSGLRYSDKEPTGITIAPLRENPIRLFVDNEGKITTDIPAHPPGASR